MKISFDFDHTLEFPAVQRVAKDLIDAGYEVCILTTRYSDVTKYSFDCSNDEVYRIAKELGITEINFTEYEWKYTCIDDYNIDVHVDDNYRDEIFPINERCKAKAVLYSNYSKSWEDKLYKAISEIENANRK